MKKAEQQRPHRRGITLVCFSAKVSARAGDARRYAYEKEATMKKARSGFIIVVLFRFTELIVGKEMI